MASSRVRIPSGLVGKIELAVSGDIGREMLRRGVRVEGAAKLRLASSPTRIDTGRLRASIATRPIRYGATYGARVGSDLQYALYVHEGTGIYGPRHAPIRPTRGRVLRFIPKGAAKAIYRPSVKGMRPNPFLRDALPAARG